LTPALRTKRLLTSKEGKDAPTRSFLDVSLPVRDMGRVKPREATPKGLGLEAAHVPDRQSDSKKGAMTRKPTQSGKRPGGPLPSREEVRRFVREQPGKVGKREIARAFNIGPDQRAGLRDIVRDLTREGVLENAGHRRVREPGRLPEVALVQVTGTDPDGDAIARPVVWEGQGPPPQILMHPERRGRAALAPGARVLARLRPIGPGRYEGRTIHVLAEATGRVVGVYRAEAGRNQVGRITPTDRRSKGEWLVPPGEENGAEDGEIVLAEPLPGQGYGLKPARVTERLGRMGDARSVSAIVIAAADIPTVFPPAALAAAKRAKGVELGKRADLREVPLVTIDGEDARDFDDAVFATPDGAGYRLIVAIADVAHYVRHDTALDTEARNRGNSVYFPDRVVPMLPEELSNGWCSLKPGEERGCLFVEMRITLEGRKISHLFGRGLMRSAARLTYEQVQEAADRGDELDLPDGALRHLFGAFRALAAARETRGTLDLDLPERKVSLDDQGKVAAIAPRPRLDSHRLIEEFMILANVCAAEELERLAQPCMYRVHAPPSDEKLFVLRSFLHGLGISLPPAGTVHPRDLSRVLAAVAGTEQAPLVNEVVLRSQSQAAYSPDNIGHFGLALPKYAHFTSPIRRYADLLVHRALITGLRLGAGGLAEAEIAGFVDAAEHISRTERRAALAERDAIDRYLAAFMADKVGQSFAARVSGVTRFGIFITLADSGASGLVPVSSLGDDYWVHDETAQTLTGRHSQVVYRLAQTVTVRLAEANPVTGGLVFQILDGAEGTRRLVRPARPHGRGNRRRL
jgi:ribonuclease R